MQEKIILAPLNLWPRWSICVLVYYSWLLNHMIYLKVMCYDRIPTRNDQRFRPRTLKIDLILWQLILWAENVKSWLKSWVFPFTFQVYILPNTLNCMCVSLFKFRIWILEHFLCCQKWPALPRHIKVWVSFELFGALYCISLHIVFINLKYFIFLKD